MLKYKELMERINIAKAKMGDVIKDFRDSDAPQFKGKSDEKRRQMAIAAKLEADRGVKEEVDMGQAERGMRSSSRHTGGYHVVDKAGKVVSKHANQGSAMRAALNNDDHRVKAVKEEVELEEGSYKEGETRMGGVGPITTDAERRERARKYREKMMKTKKEGYVPTADEPTEHDKKVAQKVRDMMAKEKKPVKEAAERQISRDEFHKAGGHQNRMQYTTGDEKNKKYWTRTPVREESEQTHEELKGNQHKIDANKNGKIDGHDFKILRNAKKARYQ